MVQKNVPRFNQEQSVIVNRLIPDLRNDSRRNLNAGRQVKIVDESKKLKVEKNLEGDII
jgi:hypothetical protein